MTFRKRKKDVQKPLRKLLLELNKMLWPRKWPVAKRCRVVQRWTPTWPFQYIRRIEPRRRNTNRPAKIQQPGNFFFHLDLRRLVLLQWTSRCKPSNKIFNRDADATRNLVHIPHGKIERLLNFFEIVFLLSKISYVQLQAIRGEDSDRRERSRASNHSNVDDWTEKSDIQQYSQSASMGCP